jgi:hypothetical protein
MDRQHDDISGVAGSFVASNTALQFLAGNPQRRTLRLSCGATNRMTVSDNSNVTDLAGLVLPAGGTSIELLYEDYGLWLCKPLYVVTNTGNETLGFIAITGGH